MIGGLTYRDQGCTVETVTHKYDGQMIGHSTAGNQLRTLTLTAVQIGFVSEGTSVETSLQVVSILVAGIFLQHKSKSVTRKNLAFQITIIAQ